MQEIKLYNSLTRAKEVFQPIRDNDIRLYACGPTVYNYAHIGNARMAVVFDTLTRLLKTIYPKVTYASNITDVDDKIMHAAAETGKPIAEITEHYTDIYNADMDALGCAPPDIQPRATAHITHMIALIEKLIERGHAYAADGHVLFHVPSFDAYGGLSGRSRDEQIAGARVEVASYKKDPADFVLWKPSKGEEPGWPSPWPHKDSPQEGLGRPGWHIECSAMSEEHLGLPFDIHGGGADLKFPHHENEIAQSCCAHGHADNLESYAKFWVHNGFVTVEGEKMSKSLGNVTLVHDLLQDKPVEHGIVLRLALLSAQYRKPLDWSAQAIHQAEILLGKIQTTLTKFEHIEPEDTKELYPPVLEALCDDLNTPLAFAKLQELLKTIPKASDADLPRLKAQLINTVSALGVDLAKVELGNSTNDNAEGNAEIDALLAERTQAKKDKNFARADEIRDTLASQGIEIIDTPDGPQWRAAS